MKLFIEMARRHIPVGRWREVPPLFPAFALAILSMAFAVCATAAPAPKKLLSAKTQDGRWIAALRIDVTQAGTVRIVQDGTNCPAPYPLTLVAGGSFYVRNFAGLYFCGGSEFQLFTVPNAAAFTVWSFNDGKTKSSFKLGPIGAVEIGRPSAIAEAASDDLEGTWINAIGSGIVIVDFYDGSNALIATERVNVSGPTQARLSTKGTGRLVLTLSDCRCNFQSAPIYGFVTVGSPDGGNLRAYPFGE